MSTDHREIKNHIQTQTVTAVEEQGPLWPISNTWISSHVLSCNLLHTAQTSRPHSHEFMCSHVIASPILKAPADGHVHDKHRFSIIWLSITCISIGQNVVDTLVNLINVRWSQKQTGWNQQNRNVTRCLDVTTLSQKIHSIHFTSREGCLIQTQKINTAVVEGQTAIGLFCNQIKGHDTQRKGADHCGWLWLDDLQGLHQLDRWIVWLCSACHDDSIGRTELNIWHSVAGPRATTIIYIEKDTSPQYFN